MSNPNHFTNNGFTVLDSQNNTKNSPREGWQPQVDGVFPSQNMDLLQFLKTNYPSIIKDNEINLNELKVIAGLPVDEKTNGYGLNFVGRNVARSKYAKKTKKELKLNSKLSKNIDTTKNLVLKGDNLDSLKILKNHYQNKIKCIYIDPPYNTTSDEFVYPDKFNKEEAEVLGIATDTADFERMEFSFKTKKSHNGWLSFMYPRLMLARDLLKDDGVIFISIDDNEQANLKLLCDEIFGEENFVGDIIWRKKKAYGRGDKYIIPQTEYILTYRKSERLESFGVAVESESIIKRYKYEDDRGKYELLPLWHKSPNGPYKRPTLQYELNLEGKTIDSVSGQFLWKKDRIIEEYKNGGVEIIEFNGKYRVYSKAYLNFNSEGEERTTTPVSYFDGATTSDSAKDLTELFQDKIFDFSKPVKLIKHLLKNICSSSNDIILDFFAGSGTTGHAVMQLNSEDGGNRKFILCQIDEPIKKDKPAYKFCKENGLEPVISSITIERLKRAGEQIESKKQKEESKNEGKLDFEKDVEAMPSSPLDTGFKVFDSVDSPSLALINEFEDLSVGGENSPLEGWQPQVDGVDTTQTNTQVELIIPQIDSLSRIYNIIFSVGLDEPSQIPETVMEDCIYKIGNNYYITNSEKISKEQFSEVIKSGNVFIDGWTASLNATLQNYKEDVKIVF
jgi:adenine-specific DNA-methyltransferase